MANVLMHPSSQTEPTTPLFLRLECSEAPVTIQKIELGRIINEWKPNIDGVGLRMELVSQDPQLIPAEYREVAFTLNNVARKGPKDKPNIMRLAIKVEAMFSQYRLRLDGLSTVIRFSAAAKSTVLVTEGHGLQLRWSVECYIPAMHLADLVHMKSANTGLELTIENPQLDMFEVRGE